MVRTGALRARPDRLLDKKPRSSAAQIADKVLAIGGDF